MSTLRSLKKRERILNPLKGIKNKNEEIVDSRFQKLFNDPKYKEVPKKVKKIELNDERFNKLLTDRRFNSKTELDQYGKKTKSNTSELEKYYSISKNKDSEEIEKPLSEESEEAGSFEEKEDGSSDTSEEFEEFLKEYTQPEADLENEENGDNNIPTGEETSRLSVLNLDWENVTANDLMVLFTSFCGKGQSIKKVEIYPSEFGIKTREKEKHEGPSLEIFESEKTQIKSENPNENNEDFESDSKEESISDIDDVAEKENDDDYKGFDKVKLREYELQKLKYFYAVVYCDSVETASNIYNTCDGMELERTQCFLDLRFVPDSLTEFPYPPTEVCKEIPLDYDPKFGFNRAVQHTKVKLTWDANDTKREERLKKSFKKENFNEDEIQDLLASSDSDDLEDNKLFEEILNKGGKEEEEEDGGEVKLLKKKKKNEPLNIKEGEEIIVNFNSGIEKLNQKIFDEKNDKKESNYEKYLQRKKTIGKEKKLKEKYRGSENPKYENTEQNVKVSTNEELALLVKTKGTNEFNFDKSDSRFEKLFKDDKFSIDPTHKDYKGNGNESGKRKKKNK